MNPYLTRLYHNPNLGAMGIFTRGGNGGTPLLVVKTDVSPSTWKGVLLNNYTAI